MRRVVHVCGAPATGKSRLRERLGHELGVPAFGIDDERIALLEPGRWWPRDDGVAWLRLHAKVAAEPACVVETAGRSPRDALVLEGAHVLRVVCVADPATRARRLARRVAERYPLANGQVGYAGKMLRMPGPQVLGLCLVWDSSDGRDTEAAVGHLLARVRAFAAPDAATGQDEPAPARSTRRG